MARLGRVDRGLFERPKGSGVWWIRYHDEHGREHREKVGPKGLAQRVYQKRKTQIAERRFFPEREIRRREVLLSQAITDRLARDTAKASYRDMKRMGAFWSAELGDRPLRSITPGDVQRAAARRREAVSQQTVAHELSFLRRVYRLAAEDGRCEGNPVRDVKPPRTGRVRELTPDEETALYATLPVKWHALLTLALHTGLRQGELFGLKWAHVDLASRTIRVPKSKAGAPRTVPLNETATTTLRAIPRRLRVAWVFPNERGTQPVNARNFARRVWHPALTAAAVEDFRWHDLRHTYASRLVRSGTDLRTVASLLGHHSLQMVMRYSHLAPGHEHEAVRKLNGYGKPTGTKTGTGT